MRLPPALALAMFVSMTAPAHAEDESRGESRASTQGLDSRIAIGYEITPVQLNLRGSNRALVGLGSYLVNAAGACNDCHTNPPFMDGGDPFQGQTEIINAAQFLAGGRPFGDIISPNITPDENGLPAGLTFEQFESMMHTGRDPDDPDRLLQIMPWNIYNKLATQDLRAMYEYLKAIPSLPDNTSPSAP